MVISGRKTSIGCFKSNRILKYWTNVVSLHFDNLKVLVSWETFFGSEIWIHNFYMIFAWNSFYQFYPKLISVRGEVSIKQWSRIQIYSKFAPCFKVEKGVVSCKIHIEESLPNREWRTLWEKVSTSPALKSLQL